MKPNIYLSRAFVEFGPFTPEEILAFGERGILRDIDHIRHHGKDDWIPLAIWMASLTPPATPPLTTPTKKTAATNTVAKKAPAKKAPAKKAPSKKAPTKKASKPEG
jgi:hypothetical protein